MPDTGMAPPRPPAGRKSKGAAAPRFTHRLHTSSTSRAQSGGTCPYYVNRCQAQSSRFKVADHPSIGDHGGFLCTPAEQSLPYNQRRQFLIGPTSIGGHHTIINNSLPRSTNHADDLTSYTVL